jgi:hypothetical protein
VSLKQGQRLLGRCHAGVARDLTVTGQRLCEQLRKSRPVLDSPVARLQHGLDYAAQVPWRGELPEQQPPHLLAGAKLAGAAAKACTDMTKGCSMHIISSSVLLGLQCAPQLCCHGVHLQVIAKQTTVYTTAQAKVQ